MGFVSFVLKALKRSNLYRLWIVFCFVEKLDSFILGTMGGV